MRLKGYLNKHLAKPFIGVFLAIMAIFTPVVSANVYAEPLTVEEQAETIIGEPTPEVNLEDPTPEPNTETPANTENTENTENAEENGDPDETPETCYDQLGAIGWLVCPTTGVIAQAIDAIYGVIEELLSVKPVTSDNNSPIYLVWQIMRDFSNIAFALMLLVVIYSQLTGLGINNYGIKKVLPRIIVAAVLVNLSFLICSICVDLSNIAGISLRGLFTGIEEQVLAAGGLSGADVSWTSLVTVLLGGTAVGIAAIGLTGGFTAFLWALIPALLSGILAVFVGLITIGLRQALISLLIMISPLAFVSYLLPNTEKYYDKWKKMFSSMLVFFPMYSVLFGASNLAGWALIASAQNSSAPAFFVIIGMALQVLPLFLTIPMLKMSGTVLGAASARLNGFAGRFDRLGRGWSASHRMQAAQNYFANSNSGSAHLRRYLDYRAALRNEDTKNATMIRNTKAMTRAQHSVMGIRNYDEGSAAADANIIRTSRYTRNAKNARNLGLEAAYTAADVKHVLDNYGDYHNGTRQDQALAYTAGRNFKELTRANMAAINDEEADTDWITNEILNTAKSGHDTYGYRHYILGAAGALGEKGTESVIAQTIAAASRQEARHRHDSAIIQNKFTYDKKAARSMYAGYYIDDNGLATDANGNDLGEKIPGQYLKNSPEKLVPYNVKDDNGDLYYNMTDLDGNFVTRIYKKDSATTKEILSNFDMPINDPVNQLWGLLSGIKEGEITTPGLEKVGLAKYSTTIGRGMLSAHFKEKAAFAGPMYATSVQKQQIKDFTHQMLARLDNLNKTAKPGNFNTQDAFELGQLAIIMDPSNWDTLFPEDSLRTAVNVNGEPLKGTDFIRDNDGNIVYDDNGNAKLRKIPADQATYEQLKNTVIVKYIAPFGPKYAAMFSHYTQNTADNQKPGTADGWNKLHKIAEKWNNADVQAQYGALGLKDPFAMQENDVVSLSRATRKAITPPANATSTSTHGAYSRNDPASSSTILNQNGQGTNDVTPETAEPEHRELPQDHGLLNYRANLEDIFMANLSDPEAYMQEVLHYLEVLPDDNPSISIIKQEVSDFIHDNEMNTDIDNIHNNIVGIFDVYMAE